MFSIIAAVGNNHELGKNGGLVFRIREDMKYFRDTTNGHKIVMGRKTWESLPGKLPGRENMVVSRHTVDGADETIENLKDFIHKHKNTLEEIFVIGGGSIYAEFLPYAKTMYLTEVDASDPDADVFFPDFDKSKYAKTIIKKGAQDDLTYTFAKYVLDK